MAPYSSPVRVRFGEIDRAGIVYYPRFFHYFHIAFEEFFADRVGIPYHVLIEKRRIGFPTVRVECDYRAPLKFGDRLDVRISVERIGRSSVTFRYRAWNRRGRRISAEALVTVVCVDMATFRPVGIPAFCRRAFEEHVEGRRPVVRGEAGRGAGRR